MWDCCIGRAVHCHCSSHSDVTAIRLWFVGGHHTQNVNRICNERNEEIARPVDNQSDLTFVMVHLYLNGSLIHQLHNTQPKCKFKGMLVIYGKKKLKQYCGEV